MTVCSHLLESTLVNVTTSTSSTPDKIPSTAEISTGIVSPDVVTAANSGRPEMSSTTLHANNTITIQTQQKEELSIAVVAGIAVGCFLVILCATSVFVSACLYFLYFKASFKRKKSQLCSSIEMWMGEAEKSGRNYERHIYDSIRDTINHPGTTITISHMTSEASGHMTSGTTGHMTSKASGHMTSKATHTDIINTRHGPEGIELVINAAYNQVSPAAVSTPHHDNHDDMIMEDNPAYQSSYT